MALNIEKINKDGSKCKENQKKSKWLEVKKIRNKEI